jgi:anti-sigma-K factor RskA
MAEHEIHELTAAYALDALDEAEELEFEEHLRTCERCRAELRELLETASALAYAVETPAPPVSLRSRILAQARSDRANVVPLRRRRRLPVYASAAVAAAAAAVALGIGLWANSLSDSLDRERALVDVLADPRAQQIALSGAQGRLLVSEDRAAVLVVAGLARAPTGKDYEVWVIEQNRPRPAGLFEGERRRDVVPLTRRVPEGAVVAVTLEDDGGVDAPTSRVLFTAQT